MYSFQTWQLDDYRNFSEAMFMRHKNMIINLIMDHRLLDHLIMDYGLWIIQLWIMDYRSFNHGSFQFNDHGLWII